VSAPIILKPEQKALLDHLSRTADLDLEARQQLAYQLETSDVARQAFVAETVRDRKLIALLKKHKDRLPRAVSEALERDFPRVKSFEELCAIADRKGEPQPELELTPPETTA
jgi:hypothetical protein